MSAMVPEAQREEAASASSALVDVGAVEEFPEGKLRLVSVNDREIGIVRWQGDFFALRNVCPHLGAPVCSGELRPLLTQQSVTDADLTLELQTPVLMCPWHHWEFDIRSGAALIGAERVKTYGIKVEDGRVKIDLDAPEHKRAARGAGSG